MLDVSSLINQELEDVLEQSMETSEDVTTTTSGASDERASLPLNKRLGLVGCAITDCNVVIAISIMTYC